MNSEFLTKKEVAELLKTGERTVDRLRKDGLPSFKAGKFVRFDKQKVLEWIDKQNK